MYEIATIEDTVRVPPNMFDMPFEEVTATILNKQYVGKLDKKLGILVMVTEVIDHNEGKVVIGDGAAFYHVKFNALFYKPCLLYTSPSPRDCS